MTANAPADADATPAALASLAEAAARAAGDVLLLRWARAATGVQAKSGPTDLVSDADREAERLLVEAIAAERPRDGVLSEEGARRPSETGLTWVLDPLDGTTNFLWRIPHWCVSVAVENSQGGVAGVVYDPLRDECFSASRGGGSAFSGRRVSGPPQRPLAEVTLAGDFVAPSTPEWPRRVELAERLLPAVGHVRSLGSVALDLAWLAAGRVDAVYHERHFHHWDIAAGMVLVSEAGMELRVLLPLAEGLSARLVGGPQPLALQILELAGGGE